MLLPCQVHSLSLVVFPERRKDLFGKVPGRKEYEALEVPKMPDYKTFFLTADAVLKSDCELHIDCLLVEMEFVHVVCCVHGCGDKASSILTLSYFNRFSPTNHFL